ncbi:unnamed protein product [Closterium sp. NIES-54]
MPAIGGAVADVLATDGITCAHSSANASVPTRPPLSLAPLPSPISRLSPCLPIQAMQLASRPHVVVATPGRLREMLQQEESMGRIFSNLQFLVLDEADRLLDRGFEEEIGAILARMPKERQTLLFSATFTANLHALKVCSMHSKSEPKVSCLIGRLLPIGSCLGFPVPLFPASPSPFSPSQILPGRQCTALLPQHMSWHTCSASRPLNTLLRPLFSSSHPIPMCQVLPGSERTAGRSGSLQRASPRPPPSAQTLSRSTPFQGCSNPPSSPSYLPSTPQCFRSCQAVSALLDEVGLSNAPLHALLPQRKRSAALHRFKASQVPLADSQTRLPPPAPLRATSLGEAGRHASDGPSWTVFTRDYVHRVGRTARAGRGGRAISLVTQVSVAVLGKSEKNGASGSQGNSTGLLKPCLRQHFSFPLPPSLPSSFFCPPLPRYHSSTCIWCTALRSSLVDSWRSALISAAQRGSADVHCVLSPSPHSPSHPSPHPTYDVHLVHSIEKLIGRQLAECTDVTEGDVLKCISKVFKARRAALLKVSESGFEERAKQRADQKRKIREERREREGGDKGEKGK